MNKDFEIKRLVIGLATLNLQANMPPPQELMPKAEAIMKSIVLLSERSIKLKQKKLNNKQEQAIVDKEAEAGIIYDEDEDDDEFKFGDEDSDDDVDNWSQGDEESDSDGELEDSTLYNVCEVLFVKQKLDELQNAN